MSKKTKLVSGSEVVIRVKKGETVDELRAVRTRLKRTSEKGCRKAKVVVFSFQLS